MKVFNGKIPENPNIDMMPQSGIKLEQSANYLKGKHDGWVECLQSILNQCKEVDLNDIWAKYRKYREEFINDTATFIGKEHDNRKIGEVLNKMLTFEQFIQGEK